MAKQCLRLKAETKLLSADTFYQSNFHCGLMQTKVIKTQLEYIYIYFLLLTPSVQKLCGKL